VVITTAGFKVAMPRISKSMVVNTCRTGAMLMIGKL
jgi:hypothetical protein